MRFSLLLSSTALAGALLLTSGRAAAQVDSVHQIKPSLNDLPPSEPEPFVTPLPGGSNPKQHDQVAPAATPGTFQPARPAQPSVVPTPAKRPLPTDVGTQVPDPVKETKRERSKWFVAANPALGFSSIQGFSYFNAGLTALFGYRVTDRFAIGPGLNYQYSSINGTGFSNVGARVFAQGLLTDNIFIHAEHEALRVEVPLVDNFGRLTTYRTTVNSTFGGLGYRQPIGSRAAFDIMLLYNFSREENFFIYGQPEFRFNFLFDLF